MIEKFSDEELRIIKEELGIVDNLKKQNVLRKEIETLNELWKEKPFAKHNCMLNIIDITLCNVIRKRRCNKNGRYYEYGVGTNIDKEIIKEYKEMFQEILEIIKKHNRKWEGDSIEQQE